MNTKNQDYTEPFLDRHRNRSCLKIWHEFVNLARRKIVRIDNFIIKEKKVPLYHYVIPEIIVLISFI